jgi:uncharacterized protein YbaP (TraB family)
MGLTPREQQIVLLNEQIQELERKRFMNQMCDHWTDENYSLDRELTQQINKLKEQLKEYEQN